MNVIISNKATELLQSLTIDVIKTEQGEFEVSDIISRYQNLFYQRMILDVTALKDYKDIKTYQKLSISLDITTSFSVGSRVPITHFKVFKKASLFSSVISSLLLISG